MHATMVFGSVLASGTHDPGVLYAPSCRGTPMVLVLGFLALAFTLLDVGLMMLTFLLLRQRDGRRLWVPLALHLAASASVRCWVLFLKCVWCGVERARLIRSDGLWRLVGWLPPHAFTHTHSDALQPAAQRLQHRPAARLRRDGRLDGAGREGAPAVGIHPQPRVDMTTGMKEIEREKCA